MTRDELLAKLDEARRRARCKQPKCAHAMADHALLEYVNDHDIAAAFHAVKSEVLAAKLTDDERRKTLIRSALEVVHRTRVISEGFQNAVCQLQLMTQTFRDNTKELEDWLKELAK